MSYKWWFPVTLGKPSKLGSKWVCFFLGGFCWHLLLISSYGHQPLSTKLWCPGHAWPILCRSNLGIPWSHHPDLRRASVHELVSWASVGLGKISHGLPWVSSFWLAVPQFHGWTNPTPVTASPGSFSLNRGQEGGLSQSSDDLCTKEGHEAMVRSSGMMGILCRASSLALALLFRVNWSLQGWLQLRDLKQSYLAYKSGRSCQIFFLATSHAFFKQP